MIQKGVEIQYEDQELLVVYKPAGLPTQSGRIGAPDLISLLKKHCRQSGYVGMVHRLDQPVEGLLVFGKTKEATASLNHQLQTNALKKDYVAVVSGVPEPSRQRLVHQLYKAKDQTAQVFSLEDTGAPREAQRAALEYTVLATGEELSKIQVTLETGRFHQIRAQMSFIGHPLLGDLRYGSETSLEQTRNYQVCSVALCACRLSLKHPKTKKQMVFQCEPKGAVFHTYFS